MNKDEWVSMKDDKNIILTSYDESRINNLKVVQAERRSDRKIRISLWRDGDIIFDTKSFSVHARAKLNDAITELVRIEEMRNAKAKNAKLRRV